MQNKKIKASIKIFIFLFVIIGSFCILQESKAAINPQICPAGMADVGNGYCNSGISCSSWDDCMNYTFMGTNCFSPSCTDSTGRALGMFGDAGNIGRTGTCWIYYASCSKCEGQVCVPNGNGTKDCSTNDDCKPKDPCTEPGGCVEIDCPTHKECQTDFSVTGFKCVEVKGAGPDMCITPENCVPTTYAENSNPFTENIFAKIKKPVVEKKWYSKIAVALGYYEVVNAETGELKYTNYNNLPYGGLLAEAGLPIANQPGCKEIIDIDPPNCGSEVPYNYGVYKCDGTDILQKTKSNVAVYPSIYPALVDDVNGQKFCTGTKKADGTVTPICVPGAQRTCGEGNFGTWHQTCQATGQQTGACTTVGETANCPNGGVQTCGVDGNWSNCNAGNWGVCSEDCGGIAGIVRNCTGGGTQTCVNVGNDLYNFPINKWSDCTGDCNVVGTERTCANGGTQSCEVITINDVPFNTWSNCTTPTDKNCTIVGSTCVCPPYCMQKDAFSKIDQCSTAELPAVPTSTKCSGQNIQTLTKKGTCDATNCAGKTISETCDAWPTQCDLVTKTCSLDGGGGPCTKDQDCNFINKCSTSGNACMTSADCTGQKTVPDFDKCCSTTQFWKTTSTCGGCAPVGLPVCQGTKIMQSYSCSNCVTNGNSASCVTGATTSQVVVDCGPPSNQTFDFCSNGVQCTLTVNYPGTCSASGTGNSSCVSPPMPTLVCSGSCNDGNNNPNPTRENHNQCSADRCVAVPGAGSDQCGSDADCLLVHGECTTRYIRPYPYTQTPECFVYPGLGENYCAVTNDCPATEIHNECNSNRQCVPVSGIGISDCQNQTDCAFTYGMCDNNRQACSLVSGVAVSQCTADSDCTTPKHNECVVDAITGAKKCQAKDGPGGNSCKTDKECVYFNFGKCLADNTCQINYGRAIDECADGTTCTGGVKHTVCNELDQCETLPGVGDNECATPADCLFKATKKCDLATMQCSKTGTGEPCSSPNDCIGVRSYFKCDYISKQCVLGGTGAICSDDTDCAVSNSPKCNDLHQCSPNGTGKECSNSFDCSSYYTHNQCNIDTQTCENIPVSGIDECGADTGLTCGAVVPDCIAGATQTCNGTGTQTCQADGTWGTCVIPPDCAVGATQTCNGTGTQTCQADGTWGACVLPKFCDAVNQTCSETGSGPACTQVSDCVFASHYGCNTNKQCVLISGAGLDSCDSTYGGMDCYYYFHNECNINTQQCEVVNSYGTDLCGGYSGLTCSQPTATYCDSMSQTCTTTGTGALCLEDNDCKPHYCDAESQTCSVNGMGIPCTENTQCQVGPFYCNTSTCQCSVTGTGNVCTYDVDCTNAGCTPTKCNTFQQCTTVGNGPVCTQDYECLQYHNICNLNEEKCEVSATPGIDECDANTGLNCLKPRCDVATKKCIPGGTGPLCAFDYECLYYHNECNPSTKQCEVIPWYSPTDQCYNGIDCQPNYCDLTTKQCGPMVCDKFDQILKMCIVNNPVTGQEEIKNYGPECAETVNCQDHFCDTTTCQCSTTGTGAVCDVNVPNDCTQNKNCNVFSDCTDSWDCTSWGSCLGGYQNRNCTYTGNCVIQGNKPDEYQYCYNTCNGSQCETMPGYNPFLDLCGGYTGLSCTDCTSSQVCSNGAVVGACDQCPTCTGTKTCDDQSIIPCYQDCPPTTCVNINCIVSACANNIQTTTCSDGCGNVASIDNDCCLPNTCGSWSECVNGTQSAMCTDSCGTSTTKTQDCPTTCTDTTTLSPCICGSQIATVTNNCNSNTTSYSQSCIYENPIIVTGDWSICDSNNQQSKTDVYQCTGEETITQSCVCTPTYTTTLSPCICGSQTATTTNDCNSDTTSEVQTCTYVDTFLGCDPWGQCVAGFQNRLCNYQCSGGHDETRCCVDSINCGPWSACVNNIESRTCVDSCGGTVTEEQTCTTCQADTNWQCTDWSGCVNGEESRTCTDDCGNQRTETQPNNQTCLDGREIPCDQTCYYSHSECSASQCISIPTLDINWCGGNTGLTCTHFECDYDLQKCVEKDGAIGDSCTYNWECVKTTHLDCNSSCQCEPTNGVGKDKCSDSNDCNGPVCLKRNVCVDGKCSTINCNSTLNCKDDCLADADCISHTECNDQNQCALVPLPGINQCRIEDNNTINNTCDNHNICDEKTKKCKEVENPGIDLCDVVGQDCIDNRVNVSHKECNTNKQCIEVVGPGPQDCPFDCVLTHNECNRQNQCVVINTQGYDACSQNSDCAQSHTECNYFNQCVVIDEQGTDQCTLDSDCIHSVCELSVGGACQCVNKPGANIVDECSVNSDCATSPICAKKTVCQENQCTPIDCADGEPCDDNCTIEGNCCPAGNHTECQAGKCVCAQGDGVANSCQTDNNCSYHAECIYQKCIVVDGIGLGEDCDISNPNACKINNPPTAIDLTVDSGSYCTGVPGAGYAYFSFTYKDIDREANGGKGFSIQIDDDPNFTSPKYSADIYGGNMNDGFVVLLPGVPITLFDSRPAITGGDVLNYGVDYYWRVQVTEYNGNLKSDWVYYDGNKGTTDINLKISFKYKYSHPAPYVDFIFTPTSPKIGEDINFTSSSRSQIFSTSPKFLWTFGDNGLTSALMDTKHVYDSLGTFTVNLQVCDAKDENGNDLCCSKSDSVLIRNEYGTELPKFKEIAPY